MTEATRSDGWTAAEEAQLEALRAEKKSWWEIGDILGRTGPGCSQRMSQIRKSRGQARLQMKAPWSSEDVDEMVRLREVENLRWAEIDRRMNRPRGCSATKYNGLRRQPLAPRPKPPQAAYQAHATLTGAILGDPLPGRSALDRKRAGIVDPPARIDGRPSFERLAAEMASRITLPGAPLR